MPQEQSASRNARAIRALSRSPISRAHSAAAHSNHASPLIRRSSSLPSDTALSLVALYGSDGPAPTLSATSYQWSWPGYPPPPASPTAPVHGPPSPDSLSSLTTMDSDDVVPEEPVHIASTPISPMSSVYPTSLSASSYVPASPGTLSYGSSFVYEDVDMASETSAPAEEPQMDPHGPYPYFPSSGARTELHLITTRLCEAEDVYLRATCDILTDNQYAFEDSASLELHLLTARLRSAEDDYIAAARDISVDAYCLLLELGVN
ncbi:hypothetical protein PLEOSDRAFT_1101098 [Pleurotus ostreatus PC15]|uniref:Uncharacterized protein n=2 Tax=Pleurotus TaxID=5320 RepID=A0A067NPS7_PLEO1|nr:hypothetical protein CCMSSC00406_0010302 [Pleurotus cornucopiae]KDQ30064.1 hypothetical protein PLEOSDRAFT_154774 [Pleurotus ostreatus PC15]KDQ30078.1 hypothetical protein PLEOSDRAFT_1101098 [Pleurotus ostreatus PC15]